MLDQVHMIYSFCNISTYRPKLQPEAAKKVCQVLMNLVNSHINANMCIKDA